MYVHAKAVWSKRVATAACADCPRQDNYASAGAYNNDLCNDDANTCSSLRAPARITTAYSYANWQSVNRLHLTIVYSNASTTRALRALLARLMAWCIGCCFINKWLDTPQAQGYLYLKFSACAKKQNLNLLLLFVCQIPTLAAHSIIDKLNLTGFLFSFVFYTSIKLLETWLI